MKLGLHLTALGRRLKWAVKRSYYILRPSLHQRIAYKHILDYLNYCDLHYLQDDKNQRVVVSFRLETGSEIEFHYFVDNNHIVALAQIQSIPEEQIRDAMLLSAHLNLMLRPSIALINPEQCTAHVIHYFDCVSCVLYPQTIARELYKHQTDTRFAADNIDYLLSSGEDPVFVVDAIRRKWQKKEDEKANNSKNPGVDQKQ